MSEQNIENIVQENNALRSKVNVLEEELALANQQLEWFRKQIFGRKTEQTSVIMDGGVQLSMTEDEEENSPEKPEETITVPEHKRKKKRTYDDWMNSLPVEEIDHTVDHPVCEICGAEMEELTLKFVLSDKTVYLHHSRLQTSKSGN